MSQHRSGGGQGNMTVADKLPAKAMNLARRVGQLVTEKGNGRLQLELVVVDGRWLLFVGDGDEFEDLGNK